MTQDNWREQLQKLILSELNSDAQQFLKQLTENWQKNGANAVIELRSNAQFALALVEILKTINSSIPIEKMLGMILDKIIELTGAERGFILMGDRETARHFDGEDIVGDYKISRTIAGKVKRNGKPIITQDAANDKRFNNAYSIKKNQARSILCLPIIAKEKIVGVLYLDNRMINARFHEGQIKPLSIFTEQTAIAVENARLYQELSLHARKLQLLNAKLSKDTPRKAVDILPLELSDQYQYYGLYGRNHQLLELVATIEKVKNYNLPILIEGESGTGKELVARAVHLAGRFSVYPFVCENCAAIPESLVESELFGYEKGAFSGAVAGKKGLFEQAEGGILFLDEVGELPIDIQKKLLRVLAENSLRRLGGQENIPINVRIITATNKDLREMLKQGTFREDLFYRLNGVSIVLPPLRERREDISMLVDYFLREMAEIEKVPIKKISKELLSILIAYDWPGNVRQLRNEVRRLAALSGPVLEKRYLSHEIMAKDQGKSKEKIRNLPELLREIEKKEIVKALEYTKYNQSRAAQYLGINRFTIQRKMEKYGLK